MSEGIHELRAPARPPAGPVCQFGGGRACDQGAELKVYLPDTVNARDLCREHAGAFMLAAAGSGVPSIVFVMQLPHLAHRAVA